MENSYGFGKAVSYSFEVALEKVTEALKNEGFGILTEIDASATIKKKLNIDMLPYRILGACNPTLAHKALEAEPSIGLLLPCNVVVRMENNKVFVEFMDPNILMEIVNKPEIDTLAKEVRKRLQNVMDAI